MVEKTYKIGEHSLTAEQLGNVFVQWYATVKKEDLPVEEVAKKMKGASAGYLNDLLNGKKVVDGRHAPGFATYFRSKAVRPQVEEYLKQYAAGNMDIDLAQSKAISQIVEGVSALVDQDSRTTKKVDDLDTRVDHVETGVDEVQKKVDKLPKDVASVDYVDEQSAETKKGYEKKVKDAVKPLATKEYVDKQLQSKKVDPEAFRLLDHAEATLEKLLKKLNSRKKK